MITVLVLWYGGHLIKNLLMKPDIMISFVLYQFELSDCFNAIGTVYTGMHITNTFIYCFTTSLKTRPNKMSIDQVKVL